MPLKPGYTKEVINKNTQRLIEEGYNPKQAYAIANSTARRSRKVPEKPSQRSKKSLLRRILGIN